MNKRFSFKQKCSFIKYIGSARTFFCVLISTVCFYMQEVSAQQYPVQIQPTVTFPSVFLNDYTDPANVNIRVYLADLTKTNYTIRVKIQLTGSTASYTSINGISLTLNGGQVYFLNNQDLASLFSTSDLTMTGSNPNQTTNTLPEGPYSLTMEAFDGNLLTSGTVLPVSNFKTDFTIFTVVLYDPPMLNYPSNSQVFDLQTINQSVFFNWTPRQIVYTANQPVKYRFRLIKVIPVDRNPYDAINATIPANLDESNLDFPTFIYSPEDLPLQEGCVYAWQVQAYELINNQLSTARFKNQGYSEVYTFSVKENCDQITLATPVINDTSVTFSWSGTSVYNEYEFDYRPFGTSLPWIPVDTTANTLRLSNRVLQPGVTYEYTIKARCNNWLSSVYGGTFSLPVPPCAAPSPVQVNTNDPANTILNWTPVPGLDSLLLNYMITGSSNPFTTVTISASASSYTLPGLAQGGYTIRLDAACGGNIINGVQNSFQYNDNGVVGACPIPTPFQFMAQRVVGDTASLSWNTVSVNTGYSITYWDKDSVQSQHTIGSLTAPNTNAAYVYDNEIYVYQITYMCGTKSTVTPQGMFRIANASSATSTDAPTADCFPPVDLQAQPRSTTSALFDWKAVSGADDYQIFYGIKGTTSFTPFNTTASTALIKNLADTQKYYFVVRARCGGLYSIFSDTALVDLSTGNGNPNCDSASFVTPLKSTTNNILLSWGYDPSMTGYLVTYRDTSQSPSNFYTQAFTNKDSLVNNYLYQPDSIKFTFQNLKSGTKYIFSVQALCGTQKAMQNSPVYYSTLPDDKSTGSCGSAAYCNKTDVTPLTALKIGDTIYCADYQIEVDKLDNTTSATGIYSGTGHMAMPMPGISDFVTMSVSFNNVKINNIPNKCIYDGVINIDSVNAGILPTAVRDSLQSLVGMVDNTISQAQSALKQAQGILDTANSLTQKAINYFQGGEGVGSVKTGTLGDSSINTTIKPGSVATINGNSVTIGGATANVESLPVLLRDNSNKVYQVNASGNITYVGHYDTSYKKTITPDLSNQVVTFSANPNAVYDFDAWQKIFSGVTQIEQEYELIGSSYRVPAKCITPAVLDVVNASINTNASDAANVVFANDSGFIYDQKPSGTSFTINLAGGPASDAQNIYAWYVKGKTKTVIGKLLVASYAPQVKKVVIVPVKKNLPVDASVFQDYLNQTYGTIGITYQVSIDTSFINNTSWDVNGDGVVQVTGSNLISNNYQGEEALMVLAYTDVADTIDPNAAYILAPYEASNSTNDLLGVMPFQEQFGFLFTGVGTADLFKRTVAHELGHGAYYLEHTFNSIYLGSSSEGTTNNLMDYTQDVSANALWKLQWDIVNAPGHVWGILQSNSSSQSVWLPCIGIVDDCKEVDNLFNKIRYARSNNIPFTIYVPPSVTYSATNVKYQNMTYNEIDVIFSNTITTNVSVSSYDYVTNQEVFNNDGTISNYYGIVFYDNNNNVVLTIDINDNDNQSDKRDSLRKYLCMENNLILCLRNIKNTNANMLIGQTSLQQLQGGDFEMIEKNVMLGNVLYPLLKGYFSSDAGHINFTIPNPTTINTKSYGLEIILAGTDRFIVEIYNNNQQIDAYSSSLESWLLNKSGIINTPPANSLEGTLSVSTLQAIFPSGDAQVMNSILPYLNQYLSQYNITSCVERIHFFAQIAEETGGLTLLTEAKSSYASSTSNYKGRGLLQLTGVSNYKAFQNFLLNNNYGSYDLVNNPDQVSSNYQLAVLSAVWYWKNAPSSTHNCSYYAVDLDIETCLNISRGINCGHVNYCYQDGSPCYTCPPNGWSKRKAQFIRLKNTFKC